MIIIILFQRILGLRLLLEQMLTPISPESSQTVITAWILVSKGIGANKVSIEATIRPTFTLKVAVYVKGGNGSIGNPYRITT